MTAAQWDLVAGAFIGAVIVVLALVWIVHGIGQALRASDEELD